MFTLCVHALFMKKRRATFYFKRDLINVLLLTSFHDKSVQVGADKQTLMPYALEGK